MIHETHEKKTKSIAAKKHKKRGTESLSMILCASSVSLCLCGSLAFSPPVPLSPLPPLLVVRRETGRGQYGLKASGVNFAEAIPALEAATGCTIEADKKIGDLPLECDLGMRSPDRLFLGVARRLNAAFRLEYVFRPLKRGEMERVRGAAFVGQTVRFKPTEEQVAVREIGRRLGMEFRVEGNGRQTVKVWSVDRPLVRLLDSIASQIRARWSVVIHIEETDRYGLGSEILSYDAAQRHFTELTRLSPEDRQAEIASRVEALKSLEGEERETTLRGLEAGLSGLSQLYRGVPGEHRDYVRGLFFAIGKEYYQAFGRLSDANTARYNTVYDKLGELEKLVGQ